MPRNPTGLLCVRPAGTRWLFYVVFDILLAEGDDQEEDKKEGAGAVDIDEVVRDAVRNTIAPCPPPTEVKAGNLTVGCLLILWCLVHVAGVRWVVWLVVELWLDQKSWLRSAEYEGVVVRSRVDVPDQELPGDETSSLQFSICLSSNTYVGWLSRIQGEGGPGGGQYCSCWLCAAVDAAGGGVADGGGAYFSHCGMITMSLWMWGKGNTGHGVVGRCRDGAGFLLCWQYFYPERC